MKNVKKLMMYFIAGTLIFSACKKDDDDDDNSGGSSDSTKPTAQIDHPMEGASVFVGTDLHFEGKVMDETNLASYDVAVSIAGTEVATASGDATGTEATVHEMIGTSAWTAGAGVVTFTARDAAGNTSDPVAVNITVNAPDNTKPTVVGATIKVPSGNKLESGSTPNEVEFHFTDDVELGEITIALNNTSLTPAKDIWNTTIAASETAGTKEYKKTLNVSFSGGDVAGINDMANWVIKVKDAAGNETDASLSVTIYQ